LRKIPNLKRTNKESVKWFACKNYIPVEFVLRNAIECLVSLLSRFLAIEKGIVLLGINQDD
jgi:hypothetical protein